MTASCTMSTQTQRARRDAARREQRDRAALLLWEDRLTDAAIARSLGICRRTLAYWKRRPEVIARIVALGEAYRARR